MIWDRDYTYHVVRADTVIARSRNSHDAREIAQRERAQLWRTPLSPEYPAILLCDFAGECWRRTCEAIALRKGAQHGPTTDSA